jgi:hypothetical protein
MHLDTSHLSPFPRNMIDCENSLSQIGAFHVGCAGSVIWESLLKRNLHQHARCILAGQAPRDLDVSDIFWNDRLEG